LKGACREKGKRARYIQKGTERRGERKGKDQGREGRGGRGRVGEEEEREEREGKCGKEKEEW